MEPDRLLDFIFILARNDDILKRFLLMVQFVRDRPTITIAEVEREYHRLTAKANEKT